MSFTKETLDKWLTQADADLDQKVNEEKTYLLNARKKAAALLEKARLVDDREKMKMAERIILEIDTRLGVKPKAASTPTVTGTSVPKPATPKVVSPQMLPETKGIIHVTSSVPLPVEAAEGPVRITRHSPENLSREEIDELAVELIKRYEGIINQEGIDKHHNVDLAWAAKIREAACHYRAIKEVGTTPLLGEFTAAIGAARQRAGDTYWSTPFDYRFEMEYEDWKTLANLYKNLAFAIESFDEVEEVEAYSDEARQVIDHVAAAQTVFFRGIKALGARCAVQQIIYEDIRCWLDSYREAYPHTRIYLTAWRPEMSTEALIAMEERLPKVLDYFRDTISTSLFRKKREESIEKTVQLLSSPGFGEKATRAKDRAALYKLLRECKLLGMPSSHPQVREALLPWVDLFLKGEEEFSEIEREVRLEQVRRGLIPKQDEEIDETPISAGEVDPLTSDEKSELEAVIRVIEGKHAVILGGNKRQIIQDRLKKELKLASVDWPDTHKGESSDALRGYVSKADVVFVLIAYASHSWSDKKFYEALGNKKLVLVPTGYGLKQIVHQAYIQITPEGKPKRA